MVATAPSAPLSPTPAPVRRREEEQISWWEEWHLVVLAVACWAFLIAGVFVERATGHTPVVTGIFIAAYLAGGTFAAYNALRDLFV